MTARKTSTTAATVPARWRRPFAIAAVLLLTLIAPARAMYCTPLGSGGLIIGDYQPLQSTAIDAQTSFAIECFPASPGEPLQLTVRLLNAGRGLLQLPNTQSPLSAGTLRVQLYRDAARTLPLDEQTTISFSDRPVIPTRYSVSLYARVPARQDVGVGQYQLPLTVIIEY